jgi:hypothetical protein
MYKGLLILIQCCPGGGAMASVPLDGRGFIGMNVFFVLNYALTGYDV